MAAVALSLAVAGFAAPRAARADDAGATYVLVVGVNSYLDTKIPALRFAEADAREVYKFFSGGVEGLRGIGGAARAPLVAPAGSVMISIAATGASEMSAEDPDAGQGVFTLALLRGLPRS